MPPKRCSAKDCASNGVHNSDAPMFKFPRDLERCRSWVKNTGNEKLLQLSSRRLCVRRYLCADHFEENQFFDKFQRRLKRHAIPTIFFCAPLSDELMSKFPVLEDRDLARSNTLDDETGHKAAVNVICNKYISFPLPCSKVTGNFSKPFQCANQNIKIENVESTDNLLDGGSCVTEETTPLYDEENQLSIIKIPCESSINGVNSLLPGLGSITYIEGPWSKPVEGSESISVEIFDSSDAGASEPLLFDERLVEQSGDHESQEIIVHHVDMGAEAKENSQTTLQQPSKLPFTDANPNFETKAVQCSDFPIPESDQLPPEIENLLLSSSSILQRHFVLQSKQLANGGQVRVICSVPGPLKH